MRPLVAFFDKLRDFAPGGAERAVFEIGDRDPEPFEGEGLVFEALGVGGGREIFRGRRERRGRLREDVEKRGGDAGDDAGRERGVGVF